MSPALAGGLLLCHQGRPEVFIVNEIFMRLLDIYLYFPSVNYQFIFLANFLLGYYFPNPL